MAFAFDVDEDKVFAQLREQRARQQQAYMAADPAVAAAVAANASAFPHMTPGVALALGQGGFSPDSPTAQQAAHGEAVRKVRAGFGFHVLGDVVSGAATAVAGVGHAATTVIKPVTRTALTGFAAGYEEGQGAIRNLASFHGGVGGVVGGAIVGGVLAGPYGALGGAAVGGITGTIADKDIKGTGKWESQSEAGIALGDLLHGRKVDLGSGYLPGGKVREEQSKRANRVQVGGHALTPGRLVADSVSEPGTQSYRMLSGLVDFAGAVKADPANLLGGEVAKANRARKFFNPEEAGLVNGLRKTTATDRVVEWLENPDAGGKVVDELAKDESAYSIWRRTGKKLDVEDTRVLAGLTDPAAVKAYLKPKLGVQIYEKPNVGAIPTSNPVVRRIVDARVWQGLPGKFLDFDDPNGAAQTMDNFLRNAGIRDEATLAKHYDALASALAPGALGSERYAAVTAAADAVKDVLVDKGTTAKVAHQATTLFRNSFEELRAYNVDAIGNDEWFPGVKVGGAGQPVASPHLLVEALASKVPLPNAQDIRRATSWAKGVFDFPVIGPGIKGSEMVVGALVDSIWKPMVLIRGAWTARVIGEEQIRMAASGFDSFANHPLSALATVVNDDGRLGKLLDRLGVEGRAQVDVKGELFREQSRLAVSPDEHQLAQYQGRVADPGARARKMGIRGKIAYQKEEAPYTRAWADELMQLRSDPIGRRVAQGGLDAGDKTPNALRGIDGIKDWFWNGTGRTIRQDLSEHLQGTDPLGTRAAADGYIDSVLKRVETKTGGHPDLINAIATGELGDANIRLGDQLNPKFVDQLDALREHGPQAAKGDVTLTMRGGQIVDGYNAAINHAFELLMVKPSNKLSRSSTFRQAYWQRMGELAPFMDEATQTKVITAAAEANVERGVLKRIAENAQAGQKGTITSLDQADTVAKAYALHTTRDLLYDIAEKGQLSDQLRLILPFAEAWKEVLTRWGKIVVENPRVVRRGQQIVEGARGAGWFHPDPTTGEEVFNYPGSGFLSEHLLGVRVPMTGRVAGLSLASSVVPGVGPVVQYPAAKLLPNTPKWDAVRQVLLPFGDPQTEGGTVESFLPAWMQKFRTAFFRNDPEHDRQFANTVMDVARYLVSTGDYSTSTPEAVDKLMTDATNKAKGVYVLRGAAQFVAPSAPTPQMLAVDKDGHFQVAQTLIEDFRKMQEEDYNTAVATFLDKYGEGALLFMQPKTSGAGPATSELAEWARANPDVVRQYKDVYSFFGPQGGDFDINFYNQQLARGERKPISPDDAVKAANNRVAQMAYRQAKERIGTRTDDQARLWLSSVRVALMDDFPGYNPEGLTVNDVPARIAELERAAKNPKLAKTDAGRGISLYLQARGKALAAARDSGLTGGFAQANSARPIRDWLRGVADAISQEHPDFAPAYDGLLSREFKDDAPVVEQKVA